MKLGIIQGRLTPRVDGHMQEFPNEWKSEFDTIPKLGISHIDWIVTKKSFDTNPLFTEDLSSLPINSICADNLIDNRFSELTFLRRELIPICDAAHRNGIRSITIPLLEDSSIIDQGKRIDFIESISIIADEYPETIFSFEFESDLDHILEVASARPNFRITDDTGNVLSYTRDPDSYKHIFPACIGYIDNIHLKDRKVDMTTHPPGEGDFNFTDFFRMVRELDYNGKMTIQTAREEDGKEIETMSRHISTIVRFSEKL
jgi:hypothetical protein